MKKKFLALALAAAVMAPTTSAFADVVLSGDKQTVGGTEVDTGYSADVEVQGSVSRANGLGPAGKIEVELPLATTFTVNKDGDFKGSQFEIRNLGGENVNVSVESFTEGNSAGGIEIDSAMDESGRENKGRNTVRLYLQHTIEGNTGGFDLNSTVTGEEVGNIKAGKSASFSILGIAGKKKDNNEKVEQDGVQESFTLRFRIKKAI